MIRSDVWARGCDETKQRTTELHTFLCLPPQTDSDSSEYSDDDVMARGRAEPETKPILSVREYHSLHLTGGRDRWRFGSLCGFKAQ